MPRAARVLGAEHLGLGRGEVAVRRDHGEGGRSPGNGAGRLPTVSTEGPDAAGCVDSGKHRSAVGAAYVGHVIEQGERARWLWRHRGEGHAPVVALLNTGGGRAEDVHRVLRIDVEVGHLNVHDVVHLRELTPPKGVEWAEDEDAVVVRVDAARMAAEIEEEEAVEALEEPAAEEPEEE